MSWKEQDSKTREEIALTPEKIQKLEQEKAASLPLALKEADSGVKPFEKLQFQPVHSPGIYDAEFTRQDGDVIFHFWPWGYHEAERSGRPTPAFPRRFEEHLKQVMRKEFGENRVEVSADRDMGAMFVRARGYGHNQFYRQLSIGACEALHYALGGE